MHIAIAHGWPRQPLLHALASTAEAGKATLMKTSPHILLLAGSFEARHLAEKLSAQGMSYTAWLSEAPRGAAVMPQVPLLRRFEDANGMQVAIADGGFNAVLDASHTFDRSVTRQAFAASRALGLPYLRLERAAWPVKGEPRWQAAVDVAEANSWIGEGRRVFCATGWDSLSEYAGFAGEVLLLRQTRRHDRAAPYPFVELVFGDPPFTAQDEAALFRDLRVDMLICRNLGGAASRPKLDAARQLGLDVVLIDRPAPPEGIARTSAVDSAVEWVAQL